LKKIILKMGEYVMSGWRACLAGKEAATLFMVGRRARTQMATRYKAVAADPARVKPLLLYQLFHIADSCSIIPYCNILTRKFQWQTPGPSLSGSLQRQHSQVVCNCQGVLITKSLTV
jgi:hypothetical protein